MKNIKILFITLIVIMGIFFTWIFLKGETFQIEITDFEIKQSIEKKFPLKKNYMVVHVIFKNPKVKLLKNKNRIKVGTDAVILMKSSGESYEGSAEIISGIRFKNETKEFFLDNFEITKIDISGLPQNYADKIDSFALKVANEFLSSYPVYKLKASNIPTAAASILLKNFKVEDQKIIITLGV